MKNNALPSPKLIERKAVLEIPSPARKDRPKRTNAGDISRTRNDTHLIDHVDDLRQNLNAFARIQWRFIERSRLKERETKSEERKREK